MVPRAVVAHEKGKKSLSRFLPLLVRETLVQSAEKTGNAPSARRRGALLLIDLCGYTAHVSRAIANGVEELERFNDELGSFFSELIDKIDSRGGDVISFAGDALLVFFPDTDISLSEACICAAQCAIEARDATCGTIAAQSRDAFQLRIAVSTGDLHLNFLGTPQRRRHALFTGDAIDRLALPIRHCPPGAITVSPEVRGLLDDVAHFSSFQVDCAFVFLLEAVMGSASRPPRRPPITLPNSEMRRFLPKAIANRVDALGENWIAEIRFICPVFVLLTDVSRCQSELPSDDHRFIQEVEEIFVDFGGELLQARSDENGIVLVGLFGASSSIHEDDPLRATLAACAIREKCHPNVGNVAIGVSSGKALCAFYGNEIRQDYVIVSEAMNLAARLMQRREGVLCDLATSQLAGPLLEVAHRATHSIKGYERPIDVVRLRGRREIVLSPASSPSSNIPSAIVGRVAEMERIDAWLAAPEGALIIEGEPGIGKSTLLRYGLQKRSRHRGQTAFAAGSEIDNLVSWAVWRAALTQFLELHVHGGETVAETALRLVEDMPDLKPFAPLLADILLLQIPPNEITAQMEPSARAAMSVRVSVHLLHALGADSLMLVLDDGQWVDTASWSVILHALSNVPQFRLFVAMRSESNLPKEFLEGVESCSKAKIRLNGLSEQEVALLVGLRLGASTIPPPVARLIRNRSDGNPFFVENLAQVLQEDSETLQGRNDAESQTSWLKQLALSELPRTALAASLILIDRLDPYQQHIVKVSSVIGTTAPVSIVQDMLQATDTKFSDIYSSLPGLQGLLTLGQSDRDKEPVLRFRHAIIQQAAHQMMPPSQQRALHGLAAQWYETHLPEGLQSRLPRVAEHFRIAGNAQKAWIFLSRAGEQALFGNANLEAAHFLTSAMEFEDRLALSTLDRVRRGRHLAEARLKLSDLPGCRDETIKALGVCKHRLDNARIVAVFEMTLSFIRYGLFGFQRPLRSRGKASEAMSLLAQLYQIRAEVAYFEHDALALLHATFVGLGIASHSDPSPELAKAHGTVAIVLGLMRLRRLSDRHIAVAEAVSLDVGHLPTTAYVRHLACVCHNAVGDWSRAEQDRLMAADGYKQVGDLYRWKTMWMIAAFEALHRGEFERVSTCLAEANESDIFPFGPLQLRVWFRTAQLGRDIAAAFTRGEKPPSMELAQEVIALAEKVDVSQGVLCRGFAADALLLLGENARALEEAQKGLQLLRAHLPTTYYSMCGIASIAHSFLFFAEMRRADREIGITEKAARAAGKAARRRLDILSLMAPVARPCALHLAGRDKLLDGRGPAGLALLESAEREARALDMKGVAAASVRVADRARRGDHFYFGGLSWA